MVDSVVSAVPTGTIEKALRDLEERFRLTVEGICDGLTIIEAGQVVFVNDQLCEILGYSKDELTRVSSLDLATPDEGERLRRIMQEVLERGLHLDRLEFWAVRKDGTRCYIRNRYYTGHNEEGFPRRLVVTSDITEQKLAQQALLESLQHRNREMQIITEIGQDLTAATSPEEVYHRLVTLVKGRLGYYHVQVFRHDLALHVMVPVVGAPPHGCPALHLPYGQGAVGMAAASGVPVLISDVARDPHWVPQPELPLTKGELAAPIKVRDEVEVVLDVLSDSAGALTEEDQAVLMSLALQVSTIIHSLRRLEGAQTYTRHDQVLHAIARELAGGLPGLGDPQTLARTVVRELGTALGRPVFIRLGSADDLAHAPNGWGSYQAPQPDGGGLGLRQEPRSGAVGPVFPITGGE